MSEICYKYLKSSHLTDDLLTSFNRYQNVTKCWRKIDNEWVLKDIVFVEQWDDEKKKYLVECLENLIENGGGVLVATSNDKVIGVAALDNDFWGSNKQYLELLCLHVSYEMRGNGIGRKLFDLICDEAKNRGAQKLYISSHSAQETQAFYKAVGCVEAMEYNPDCVGQEPFDCQLERVL